MRQTVSRHDIVWVSKAGNADDGQRRVDSASRVAHLVGEAVAHRDTARQLIKGSPRIKGNCAVCTHRQHRTAGQPNDSARRHDTTINFADQEGIAVRIAIVGQDLQDPNCLLALTLRLSSWRLHRGDSGRCRTLKADNSSAEQ